MSIALDDVTKPDAAVIYGRVSDPKQEDEGSGLSSQDWRCRQRAEALGVPVEAVFGDKISGKGDFMKRPGMVKLLAHLDANAHKRYLVIFDDLKRYARDTEFHLALRREMMARGAIRHCLNFKFEDTPEGKFFETIAAAQGTLEREQNARQTLQKMRARMEQGYWVFHAPKGYKYIKSPVTGKDMVPDEPLASIVREALEGYAAGRLETQAEVKRYLESQPPFPTNKQDIVPQQRVTDLLTNPLYAGYICHERYGINWLKGQHEPIISLETFEKIQERRAGKPIAPARKNLNEDFPLRGFVLCGDCDKPLTACWSKGSRKKYPYYLCDTRGCASYRKSIPRQRIEGDFAEIVRALQPTDNLVKIATKMFKNAWQQRTEQARFRFEAFKQEARNIETEIEKLLERILSASNATVIAAYESKVEELERKRRLIDEKLAVKPPQDDRFAEIIEHAMQFLATPWILWQKDEYALKRLVLRLAFADRISYCRNQGYRTPQTALPFRVLVDFKKQKVRFGAVEKTRTSTGFTPQRPQRCASTNSATTACLGKAGEHVAMWLKQIKRITPDG